MSASQMMNALQACQLLDAGAKTERYRFLPYPCNDRRSIVVCAELPSGEEMQIAFRLDHPVPIDDGYDEDAVAQQFFATPSVEVH
jgi:hypothetical protein